MSTTSTPENGNDTLSPSMQSLLKKLLEQELKQPVRNENGGHANALIGRLEGFDQKGYPIVTFTLQEAHHSRTARSIVELRHEDVGRTCLIHLCDDQDSPVISGLIQPPLQERAPGETAIIRTDEGIRLQSGDAYIELTNEGTVCIRGDYVESVAYGTHRIEGGSVKIN
jgi:hypothetical protein